MNDSKGSAVIVGDQRSHDGLARVVVVPDGGGQGEDALQDASDNAERGVPAMAFEVELAFEGVVDRLDDLPQRLEEPGPGRSGSPCRAGRSSCALAPARAASKSWPK